MDIILLFEILATIAGVMMAGSGFPQAFKIFKNKSAKDISLSSRLMMLIGGIIWLIYGILISSFAIISSNIVGSMAEILVIVGYFKFRK